MPELTWSTDPVGFHRALHPAPTLTPICARRPTAKDPKGWRNDLGSLRDPAPFAAEMRATENPQTALVDLYWAICGFAPANPEDAEKPSPVMPECLVAVGRSSNSSPATMTAVWVDLDLRPGGPYAAGLQTDYGRLVPDAIAHGRALGLPEPSLLLQSGRGLWLFWVLRTPDDEPPAITPETGSQHTAVNVALANAYAPLEGCSHSVDLARVCRIPGSVHRENGAVVRWARWSDGRYALEDLAGPLRIDLATVRPQASFATVPDPAGTVDPEARKRRSRGTVSAYRKHWNELLALAVDRGGISEGERNSAVMYASICAHRLNGRDKPKTLVTAAQFNASYCAPPLSDREVAQTASSIVNRFREKVHLKNERMAQRLKVTPLERTRLGVFITKQSAFPVERRGARERAQAHLAQALETLLTERGGVPLGYREATQLLLSRGIGHPDSGTPYARPLVTKVLRLLQGGNGNELL